VKVSYGEGVANHTDLESCVTMHREVRHEALTEAQTGQPLSRESSVSSGRRRCEVSRKATRRDAPARVSIRSCVVREPGMSARSLYRNWEICGSIGVSRDLGPYREGR